MIFTGTSFPVSCINAFAKSPMLPAGALFTNKSPGFPFSKANNTQSTASSRDMKKRDMFGSVMVMGSPFWIWFKKSGITEPLEAITLP